MWGYGKLHNRKVDIGVPEVLYQKGNVIKVDNMEIYRTQNELDDFEFGLYDIVSEIESKFTCEEKEDSRIWRRNLTCDEGSNYTCEFKPICRMDNQVGQIPYGYKTKEYKE